MLYIVGQISNLRSNIKHNSENNSIISRIHASIKMHWMRLYTVSIDQAT